MEVSQAILSVRVRLRCMPQLTLSSQAETLERWMARSRWQKTNSSLNRTYSRRSMFRMTREMRLLKSGPWLIHGSKNKRPKTREYKIVNPRSSKGISLRCKIITSKSAQVIVLRTTSNLFYICQVVLKWKIKGVTLRQPRFAKITHATRHKDS